IVLGSLYRSGDDNRITADTRFTGRVCNGGGLGTSAARVRAADLVIVELAEPVLPQDQPHPAREKEWRIIMQTRKDGQYAQECAELMDADLYPDVTVDTATGWMHVRAGGGQDVTGVTHPDREIWIDPQQPPPVIIAEMIDGAFDTGKGSLQIINDVYVLRGSGLDIWITRDELSSFDTRAHDPAHYPVLRQVVECYLRAIKADPEESRGPIEQDMEQLLDRLAELEVPVAETLERAIAIATADQPQVRLAFDGKPCHYERAGDDAQAFADGLRVGDTLVYYVASLNQTQTGRIIENHHKKGILLDTLKDAASGGKPFYLSPKVPILWKDVRGVIRTAE
ncbi:MAG TPA: hypothetical protein PKL83_07180, partial [bacterium]|nr:hypothetical protein [bacterium]